MSANGSTSAAVFISHSSKDRTLAQGICDALEQRGLKCWISGRDVGPGQNFQEAIVRAIRHAKVMVLVFSANANNSDEIKKEMALASQNKLAVIPVRVDDIVPSDAFAYEFATRQWIDLFNDFDQAVGRLAHQISAFAAPDKSPPLEPPRVPARTAATPTKAPPTPSGSSRTRLVPVALGVLALAIAGALAAYFVMARGPRPLSAAQERALKPKETFRECETCPEMVVVPAGSFTMGSGHDPQAGPPHHVSIARPFAVGRFALTFDEWDACVAEGGCRYKAYDREWGRGRLPVINVSWNDAKTYLAWLARKTEKPYRLLTEAEREYVTRAGTTTPFWWGTTISTGQANYDGNYVYGNGVKGEWRRKTVPVDSFEPNPWGLYQVHGNVWEWVEDCYNDSYNGAPADGSAWVSGNCQRRVLRGGSWFNKPVDAAARDENDVAFRYHSFGIRVARALAP